MAIPPRVIAKIRDHSGVASAARIATKGGRADIASDLKAGKGVQSKRAAAAERLRGKPRRRPDGKFG